MRVLHISTNDNGGAANAAIRVHESVLAQGVDSSILFLNRSRYFGPFSHVFNSIINNHKLIAPDKPSLTLKNYLRERFFSYYSKKELFIKNQINKKKEFDLQIQIDSKILFEVYSKPTSEYDITESELYLNADIIHIHWSSGFLNIESFFAKNTKPIVWSMYDEYPILGAFHYQGDEDRSRFKYGDLDESYKLLKKKSVSITEKLVVITGSDWLTNKALNSEIFNNRLIQKVYYPVNSKLYRFINKESAKLMLNLDSTKKVFLFASSFINNHRKGFDLLLPIIDSNKFKDSIFLVMGTMDELLDRKNVIVLGKISDELLMPIIYSASDFFILPSREENFSYTMMESLCCGTPCLAFNVGDHKNFLVDNRFGAVSDTIDTTGLENVLEKALSNEFDFDHIDIANRSILFFDSELIGRKLKQIYLGF